MPVIATNNTCQQCGHPLSVQELARVHFLKRCPACHAAIAINAPGALTRSHGATAAGLVGMVLGLGACVVVLTLLGIDEATLTAWPASWQVGLAAGVGSVGSLLAYLFQRRQVNRVLAKMRARLTEEGLL